MNLSKKIKMLIVDDMEDMRSIINKMLEEIGYCNVEDAKNGTEAWKMIEKAHKSDVPYQFIISDWNMPKMNGLDLLKKIKTLDSTKEIHFLMITTESEQGNVVVAVKEGVSNFIVKPFSTQILKEKIDKVLEK